MASSQSLIFAFAFSVLVYNNNSLVQCDDECKTNADCSSSRLCCGDYFWNSANKNQRSCTYGSCSRRYCASDSDCGDPSMCCRSNQCVNKGCSGCYKNTDCDTSILSNHVCCKKTFPFDQTVCAANCVNEVCNSNDDCAGNYHGECCRSGKCTSTGCYDQCKSNSECNSDQYCCKKADTTYSWSRTVGCAGSCVGKICSTNEDCGPPNECCISNKCVDRGCSRCSTNSNCSTGHYCCKKRELYELSECSADCIGKSCGTNDDCGGPGESCDSDHRCMIKSNIPLPPWLIAVITLSAVVFLITVGIILAVCWYITRKRATSARTQAGNVPLRSTRYQGAGIRNSQPNRQLSENTFQNQPGQTNDVVHQSPHSTYYPQGLQSRAQNTANEIPVDQDLVTMPEKENENQGNQSAPHPTQQHNPVYHTLESPNAAHGPQYQDSSGQQMYSQNTQMYPQNTPMNSQNTPYQGNNYLQNPPYNPFFQGNH